MMALGLARPIRRVLALGAHPDDIEIGCAGTLLALLEREPEVEVHWVVLSGEPARAAEARRSAEALLGNGGRHRVVQHTFRDGYFPYDGGALKDCFEDMKAIAPDVVFTHTRADLHQDHRITCELTWNTFRDHLILEYEVPKFDGDLGAPNVFVPVTPALRDRKVAHLLEHFASQHPRHWFKEDLFAGMLRLRGMECGSPTALAVAFYCRKAVLA
jgi:LmbE family N-acetylglucosaminyl deacetylase